ncbi:MAG: response regulator [Planctomycetes bacterium]|nr:response regulator [Planctomycetota bacterium]
MQQETLRILVVDDESDVLEITCRMLKRLQHETVAVGGGAEAIQLLQTEPFDLAVVDTNMPGVDGNAVRRFIKENLPDLKVITASAMPPETGEGQLEPERHTYLRKPYQIVELQGAIERLMQRSLSI